MLEIEKQPGLTTAGALQNAADLVEAQPVNNGSEEGLGSVPHFSPTPLFSVFL